MLQWQEAILIRREKMSEGTTSFFFEMKGHNFFDFIPGQFVTFDLPIHERKSKRLRSYSIASEPNGTNIIELSIVYVPDGLGTNYLFDEERCPIGTSINYRGALGKFTLPLDLSHPLFLVCTGTGIAPFRSMIKHIKNQDLAFHSIHLIFGTRTQNDILYFQEMKTLAQEMDNFHYHPVLSREEWDGHNGYVHEVYKTLSLGKKDAHFMLCGWRNMIDQARDELKEMGYDKKQIHFELYG